MIEIYLHDLILLDEERKHWPERFVGMMNTIELQASAIARKKWEEAASDLGTDPLPPLEEGVIDRNTLAALVDWCQENKEPWLERACRFLIRHTGIALKHEKATYGDYCYWSFQGATMPDRWKYLGSSHKHFAGCLADLALEIKKRVEEIEGV